MTDSSYHGMGTVLLLSLERVIFLGLGECAGRVNKAFMNEQVTNLCTNESIVGYLKEEKERSSRRCKKSKESKLLQ